MDIVHAAQRTFVPNSLMKLGKATATAVLSMEYMKRLNPAAAKMRYRCIVGTIPEVKEVGENIGNATEGASGSLSLAAERVNSKGLSPWRFRSAMWAKAPRSFSVRASIWKRSVLFFRTGRLALIENSGDLGRRAGRGLSGGDSGSGALARGWELLGLHRAAVAAMGRPFLTIQARGRCRLARTRCILLGIRHDKSLASASSLLAPSRSGPLVLSFNPSRGRIPSLSIPG